LVVSGLAKLWKVQLDIPLNRFKDPITNIPYFWIFWIMGITETIIGLLTTFLKERLALFIILWLSLCFTAYRLCGAISGSISSCPCMGGVDQLFQWRPGTGAIIATYLWLYLLLCPLLALIKHSFILARQH
jgi:hypothetical protein